MFVGWIVFIRAIYRQPFLTRRGTVIDPLNQHHVVIPIKITYKKYVNKCSRTGSSCTHNTASQFVAHSSILDPAGLHVAAAWIHARSDIRIKKRITNPEGSEGYRRYQPNLNNLKIVSRIRIKKLTIISLNYRKLGA